MGVNRRLGVVAWVAATVLSVAASTTAVASVREQVTDRPDLVSLAALRRAAATGPAEPSAPSTAPSASTAARPEPAPEEPEPTTTTTTRVEIEAVPDTVVEASTPATTAPESGSTATTTTTEPERKTDRGRPNDGGLQQETRDFRGGSVTVTWDGEQLELVEVASEDGYRTEIEEQSARMIAVRFSSADRRSTTFVATVNGGRLQTRLVG